MADKLREQLQSIFKTSGDGAGGGKTKVASVNQILEDLDMASETPGYGADLDDLELEELVQIGSAMTSGAEKTKVAAAQEDDRDDVGDQEAFIVLCSQISAHAAVQEAAKIKVACQNGICVTCQEKKAMTAPQPLPWCKGCAKTIADNMSET